MQKPHPTRCAGDIRARAVFPGEQVQVHVLHGIAEEIHACCGHSRLKCFRLAWGWSIPRAVSELHAACEAAHLPTRGVDERSWRRWERQPPGVDYRDRLARLFRSGPVQLGFAADHTPPSPGGDHTNRREALRLGAAALLVPEVLARSECEAWELTRLSEVSDLGPSTLAHLQQVIGDYGHHYARYSAEELWRLALGDRHHVTRLLQLRTTLTQRRELYVAAAWLSLILAWAASDRGQVRVALAYAADARYHADEAGHSEAVAWGWDVGATTLLYDGQPDRALRTAEQGAAVAPTGSAVQTRLTGQLARIHARLGHPDPAAAALTLLGDQAERHETHAAGLFSADVARSWSVAATSHLWLGQDRQARDYATEAMNLYEQDRQVSPTRRAITLLDLGTACARLGELEEAVEHGLAAVRGPRYSSAIMTRSGSLGALLERRYPDAAMVTRFRLRLTEFQ